MVKIFTVTLKHSKDHAQAKKKIQNIKVLQKATRFQYQRDVFRPSSSRSNLCCLRKKNVHCETVPLSVQLHAVHDLCYNGKQREGRGRRKGRKTVSKSLVKVKGVFRKGIFRKGKGKIYTGLSLKFSRISQ